MTNTPENYSDPELERKHEAGRKLIVDALQANAKHMARMNRPALKGDSLDFYVLEARKFDEMEKETLLKHKPESARSEAKIVRAHAKEKMKKLEEREHAVEQDILNMEYQPEEDKTVGSPGFTPPGPDESMILRALMFLFGLAETVYLVTVLQGLGFNWLFSLILATAITGLTWWLGRNLGMHLKENLAEPFAKKKWIILGTCALAMGIALCMSFLRAEETNEHSHFKVNPIVFFLWSAAFFAVVIWYYFRKTVLPEPAIPGNLNVIRKKTHEELLREQEEIKEEIALLKEETARTLALLAQRPVYVKAHIERLRKWKAEAIEGYITTNLAFRPDRQIPDCYHAVKQVKAENHE